MGRVRRNLTKFLDESSNCCLITIIVIEIIAIFLILFLWWPSHLYCSLIYIILSLLVWFSFENNPVWYGIIYNFGKWINLLLFATLRSLFCPIFPLLTTITTLPLLYSISVSSLIHSPILIKAKYLLVILFQYSTNKYSLETISKASCVVINKHVTLSLFR